MVVAVESGSLVQDVYDRLDAPGAAVVTGLDDAMRALRHVGDQTNHTGIERVAPPVFAPLPELGPGPRDLGEDESLRVLAEAGFPAITPIAVSPTAAVRDLEMDYPIALKVSAASIFHKQRDGLIALDLPDANAAEAARKRLVEAATVRGVPDWQLVAQTMAPRGVELLLGLRQDPVFGSLVVLGAGGSLVEGIGRVALARATTAAVRPVAFIERTGVAHSLPAPALAALAAEVARFAGFVIAAGERLRECEVNPLIVTPEGRLAMVDAKLCIAE
jgi:acyl-CoA synthetase (NDP forming)